LNTGEDYGKEFVPDEINGFLDGSAFKPKGVFSLRKDENVEIREPDERPNEIIDALQKLYKKTPSVRRAWIGYYQIPEHKNEGRLLLCLDISRPSVFEKISSESGMTIESLSQGQQPTDIVPYIKDGFTSYFKKRIPFYRRNLFMSFCCKFTDLF
jgi:hypothetical protein